MLRNVKVLLYMANCYEMLRCPHIKAKCYGLLWYHTYMQNAKVC